MSPSPWLVALKKTLHMQGSPVIEFGNDSKVSEILSAANLWTQALEIKHSLTTQGFRAGDILCDISTNHHLLANMIACNMLGGCFFPLKKSDLEDVLTNESSEFPIYFWKNLNLATGYLTAAQAALIHVARQDAVLLLKTSGTSGVQKFVGISGDALLHQVKSFISASDLQAEEGRLIVLPLHHCFGLILDLFVGLFSRQTIFARSHLKFETSLVFDLLRQQEICHISLVPRMVDLLLIHADQNPHDAYLLSSLHVHVGGATISDSLRKKAKNIFAGWIEGYGLTECAGGVLLNGKPNNCEVKLKPAAGIEANDYSELWVKSPSLGKFVNLQGLDAEGFFNTEDLARLTSDQGIQVLNRAGRLIKNQKGLWESLESIQDKIQQQLQIESVWICRHGHQIRVAMASDAEQKAGLVEDYLASRLGVKVHVLIIEKSNLFGVLNASPKKSGQEAVADWIENEIGRPLG